MRSLRKGVARAAATRQPCPRTLHAYTQRQVATCRKHMPCRTSGVERNEISSMVPLVGLKPSLAFSAFGDKNGRGSREGSAIRPAQQCIIDRLGVAGHNQTGQARQAGH